MACPRRTEEDDNSDSHSPEQMQSKQLRFDRYVLDLDRGCLLRDGKEIALRPKTFAVLRYLVENSGRLVSKDELFAAVWPNLAVTDDVLVQSIGELRRALADDGPRLIKTIPRRGYRFESVIGCCFTWFPIRSAPTSPAVGDGLKSLGPNTRARTGLFAALTLVVLLVAGALWTVRSVKFLSALRSPDRSTNNSPEVGAKPAIAILPFVNQSDDLAREYFADGLTQDIINALGRFSELTVMSWNAVSPTRASRQTRQKSPASLAVRYQVEGSVRQTGDRVRVIAQLVDTDGQVLWSASFDEALADVFALQDKITTQIAGALAIRVSQTEQRRVFAKPTESLEAYDYVLRARPALQRPTRANMWRRAPCSDAPSSSTRTTLPPMRHSPKPIMSPCRWAGRNRRQLPEPRGGNGQQGAEP